MAKWFSLRRIWPFRTINWHRNREWHVRQLLAAALVDLDAMTKHRDVLQSRLNEWMSRSEGRAALDKVRSERRENSLIKTLNYCAAEDSELVDRARQHIAKAERRNA